MRSLLFAPGNRADVLAKLPRTSPSAAAIDLDALLHGALSADPTDRRDESLKTVVPTHFGCFVKRDYDPKAWAKHLPSGVSPLLIPYNQSVVYCPFVV